MALPASLSNIKELQQRYKKAFEEESRWFDLNRDVYDYFLPQRTIFNDDSPGQKKMDKIYDSTALESIQEAAGKFQAAIAPPWRRWAKVKPADAIAKAIEDGQADVSMEDVQKNLDEQAAIAFDYLNRSNFHTQFFEYLLDFLVGTATIVCNEEDSLEEPFSFKVMPPKGIGYEEDSKGIVQTHWYNVMPRGRNVEGMFPGFKASHAVGEQMRKEPDTKVNICAGVVYDPKTKDYYGVAWVKGEYRLSWDVNYGPSRPMSTGRYTKVAGEVRGRGPAMQCYPDVRSLNKAKEFVLQKAAIDLAGLWTATNDGVTNPYTLTISPGVVIPVGSNATANPSISRLDTSSNLQLVEFEINELRNSIRRAMFAEIREPSDAVVSATQFAMESRELANRMGSAFGRMQTEILIPILKRVFFILRKKGLINIDIEGFETTVKFTSPLAVAQDQEDILAIQQAVEMTRMTVGDEIARVGFNFEKFPAEIARLSGLKQELVSSESEVGQKLQAGAQAAAIQQGMIPQEGAPGELG